MTCAALFVRLSLIFVCAARKRVCGWQGRQGARWGRSSTAISPPSHQLSTFIAIQTTLACGVFWAWEGCGCSALQTGARGVSYR